jgi:hypothetical protein
LRFPDSTFLRSMLNAKFSQPYDHPFTSGNHASNVMSLLSRVGPYQYTSHLTSNLVTVVTFPLAFHLFLSLPIFMFVSPSGNPETVITFLDRNCNHFSSCFSSPSFYHGLKPHYLGKSISSNNPLKSGRV